MHTQCAEVVAHRRANLRIHPRFDWLILILIHSHVFGDFVEVEVDMVIGRLPGNPGVCIPDVDVDINRCEHQVSSATLMLMLLTCFKR